MYNGCTYYLLIALIIYCMLTFAWIKGYLSLKKKEKNYK